MNFFIIGIDGHMGSLRRQILEQMGHEVNGWDLKRGFSPRPYFSADGILICTPPSQHYMSISDLWEQAPFFIEKPVFDRPFSDSELHMPRSADSFAFIGASGFVGCNTRWIVAPYIELGKPNVVVYDHAYPNASAVDMVHFEDLKNVFPDVSYNAQFLNSSRVYKVNGRSVPQSVIDNSYVLEMVEFVKFCKGLVPSPNTIGMANETLRRIS
ncbi:MAG TPA: hypothetical protein P5110_07505 [Candidatus Omnitrophota bacterium]|nr:hypothetical protein [Candidatus Omnitrophota bacterium]